MAKQAAFGSIMKLDSTNGGTFVAIPGVIQATPPPRMRKEIDALELGDTVDVPLLGIEDKSEFRITVHYDQGDAEHVKFTTMFDGNIEGACQVVTSHGTPITKEFTVRCKKIEEQDYEPNGTIQAVITFQRTGAITVT